MLTSFRAHPLMHTTGFLLASIPVVILMPARSIDPVLITAYVFRRRRRQDSESGVSCAGSGRSFAIRDAAGSESLAEISGRDRSAVVIDAAAGFDTVSASSLLSIVSLHATKIFAAGEGGFVVTGSRQMGERVRGCGNFGFQGSRVALNAGINAKMSEYHAAVALAGLARWPATRLKHLKIIEWYRQAIARLDEVTLHPGYGEGWATGTTSVILPAGTAVQVAELLLQKGIETRSWWGQGCHVQPAFLTCRRSELPVTRDLGGRVLGLPHYPDMQKEDVARVIGALVWAFRSLGRQRRAS